MAASPELHFQAAGAEKNSAIKRIMSEWKGMQRDPASKYGYMAQPSEDDIFEWHFMFHGPPDTDFAGGVYTGRINLPAEYPFKPPEIRILTPNGRFELNKKICLSISSYHPEHWQPSWDIRTIITALIAFMPTEGNGAIGALDYPPQDRRKLAVTSHKFVHPMFDTAEFVSTVALPEGLPDIDVKAGTPSTPQSPKKSAATDQAQSSAQVPPAASPPEASPQEAAPVAQPSPVVAPAANVTATLPAHPAAAAVSSGQRFGMLEAMAVLLAALLIGLVLKKAFWESAKLTHYLRGN